MVPPTDLDSLSLAELKRWAVRLLEEQSKLRRKLAELRDEKARLMARREHLNIRNIRPSRLEKALEPKPETPRRRK